MPGAAPSLSQRTRCFCFLPTESSPSDRPEKPRHVPPSSPGSPRDPVLRLSGRLVCCLFATYLFFFILRTGPSSLIRHTSTTAPKPCLASDAPRPAPQRRITRSAPRSPRSAGQTDRLMREGAHREHLLEHATLRGCEQVAVGVVRRGDALDAVVRVGHRPLLTERCART